VERVWSQYIPIWLEAMMAASLCNDDRWMDVWEDNQNFKLFFCLTDVCFTYVSECMYVASVIR
jgi:hypothetical protein